MIEHSTLANPYFLISVSLVTIIAGYIIYKSQMRMESVIDLPREIRNYKFKGIVTSVGDGDGFRLFHVPWMRSSKYGRGSPKLPVRLTGIDAPEMRCFSTPGQPFAEEARGYLRGLILGKMVHITVLSVDMYGRIVVMVHVKPGWISWQNVNLAMLQAGMACVYDRAGAEYGPYKKEFEEAEKAAKKRRLGMWSQRNVVLPMDYKSHHK